MVNQTNDSERIRDLKRVQPLFVTMGIGCLVFSIVSMILVLGIVPSKDASPEEFTQVIIRGALLSLLFLGLSIICFITSGVYTILIEIIDNK